jgi:N-acetyl sugar amidotransferase
VPHTVSLVIPLYNEELTVDRLLQSVASQTRVPDEVVCVDAGSTDATAERLSKHEGRLPLKVVRHGRLNPGEARNAGVAAATRDWIAFTDGGIALDDRWLERLLAEARGDVEAVFGSYEPVCDAPFTRWAALAYVDGHLTHGIRGPFVASMVVSRRAFAATGGFPPWRAAEDLVFMERLLERTKVAYAPASVVRWELARTPRATWRRFYTYSRANLEAGRGRYWHLGLFRQYVVVGAAALAAAALVGPVSALAVVVAWFLARAAKSCFVKRGQFPFSSTRVDRVLGCALVLVVTDAATIAGWVKWLVSGARRTTHVLQSPTAAPGAQPPSARVHAPFPRTAAYRQCTRCVMDTSDPEITFDANGHCNHCTTFPQGAARLGYKGAETDRRREALIRKIKAAGKGSRFDSIVGVSGGLDSCYATYLAVRCGLRPLLVHMDNGWDSATAVTNIRALAGSLGLDYRSRVLDWEEFRDLQLSFLRASVPEIETPTDIAILAVLHELAAINGIRYIITGGNVATEGILPRSWHYDAKDVRYLQAIHRTFGTRRLRSFPTFGFQREIYHKLVRGIRFVYLLNYVPYSKQEAVRTLEQAVGWTAYERKHHESHFTAFVHSYVLPVKFGIDYRRATLSTQICTGETTREDALLELSRPPFDPAVVEREKTYVAKKLGVSVEELEEILSRPPRSHRDYPNNQRLLESLYRVYRRVLPYPLGAVWGGMT